LRALVQRVLRASVAVDGREVASIGPGLLVLVGVGRDDAEAQADRLADQVGALRVFEDAAGRMSEPLGDREALCVSQFTLYADTRKGRRPSWNEAAPAAAAEPLVEAVVAALRGRGIEVATGRFGAMMAVELVNDGPFTLVLDV
jgi:D-tyrosyl-tRNA(Tyr) deacylase